MMEIIAALMLITAFVSCLILIIMLFAPQLILDLSDGAAPPRRKSVLMVGVPVVLGALIMTAAALPSAVLKQELNIPSDEVVVLAPTHPQQDAKENADKANVAVNLTDTDLDQMMQQAQAVIQQHEDQVHLSAKQ